MKFDKLFKKSSTGKLQEWLIRVDETPEGFGDIVVCHGQVDGKIQEIHKVIEKGKNVGRSNETSPYEQACSEAQSQFNKQIDKGYKDSLEKVESEQVVLPMLALDFNKRSHDIKYPAYGQRKFDGVRCLASWVDGNIILKTRKGKNFPHLNHLRVDLERSGLVDNPEWALDGELYSDELPFEEITGIVRREKLKDGDVEKMTKIKYRVYDLIHLGVPGMPFFCRHQEASSIIKDCQHATIVENVEIQNEEDVKKFHDQFVSEGYEGIMIRNKHSEYGINKRSKHLQKFKSFEDDEYEITGYSEGTGQDKGCVIWECVTPEGTKFNCRPRGTVEERREWFADGSRHIGKLLTVRFQELSQDNVPRFPVGITFRDYE